MASLRQNSFYSLLSFALPTGVMLLAYPLLVGRLGADVFGVYLLGTTLSGMLAFLDLGFSAATVKYVAEDLAREDHQGAADVLVASLVLYGVLGAVGALALWALSPWLAGLFKVAPALQAPAVWVFRLAALQFFASFVTSVFLSLFKGAQVFHFSTLALTALSVLTYGGAIVAVLWAHAGLLGVSAVALGASLVVLALSAVLGAGVCRAHGIDVLSARPSRATYRRMVGFSAALVVSTLAGLLHAQLQRLLVGAMLGPQYVTSFHLGVWGPAKVNAATLAISEPLFPRASALSGAQHEGALRAVYRRYVGLIALVSFVALCPLLFFAGPLFGLWFGGSPPTGVAEVASVIAFGLFFNAIGQPAHHMVNGMGRPWINAGFAVAGSVGLYAVLGVLYLWKGGLSLMDFAWATSLSLAGLSILFLVWYEWRVAPRAARPGMTTERMKS